MLISSRLILVFIILSFLITSCAPALVASPTMISPMLTSQPAADGIQSLPVTANGAQNWTPAWRPVP